MENKEENTVNKISKPVLTDADALKVVANSSKGSVRFCDTWVPRTVLYPVPVEYKTGIFTNEIRAFVRQGEWCHSTQWVRALQLEKDFPELNKKHAEWLKSKKRPINIKPPSDNTTPLGIN